MKKQKFNFRACYERMDAIKGRMTEIADTLEKENRDATEAENAETRELQREFNILDMKARANTAIIEYQNREDAEEVNRQMRECLKNGQRFELKISRGVAADFKGNTSGYADPATSPNPAGVTMGDIVEPLYSKTILATIGSPLLTGLKGNYQWPVVEAFDATINDEGVALGDTKIPLTKLIAKPERLGVAVPVTREALNETSDLLQTVATQYIPVAIAALMNKIMFSTTKISGATNLVGPFVNMKAANKKTYSGDAPTLAQLLAIKGAVLNSNIMPEGLCYVMTETTKALLEGTPKWNGSNAAIIDDNGTINGVPVYTTSYATEGAILFGAFKYAPQGLFGDMSLIVDPYTLARKNSVDFVLNADYAITVLRQEAFGMLAKGE